MTETVAEQPVVEQPPQDDATLAKAREAERNRYTREESIRRELEETKRKLESMKRNGWDVDTLTQKQRSSSEEVDIKKEIQELKQELAEERSRRNEVEELQAIVDFVSKNPEYEFIQQLDDAPKYIRYKIQEHYKATGKYLSYADAAQAVEEQVEKFEADRFSKLSKTKKAAKIYKLPQSAEPKALASEPTSAKAPPAQKAPQVEIPEPKNLHRSNSKEAFEFFKKQKNYSK